MAKLVLNSIFDIDFPFARDDEVPTKSLSQIGIRANQDGPYAALHLKKSHRRVSAQCGHSPTWFEVR